MKLLALALISFALQASASTPRCGACSAGLIAVGGTGSTGTGCYCGTGAGGVAEVFVAADEFCDTTLAATGTMMTTAKCTSEDGSASPAAICSCGTNNEQIATSEFCFVKADKTGVKSSAAISACAVVTGLTAQPAGSSCYCGTDAVVVAATQFCFVKADNTGVMTAAATSACAVVTGLTAQPAGSSCYCGTGAVVVAATEFCDTTLAATGTKMTTARCDGAANVDGSTLTANACSCGTNNAQTTTAQTCFLKADKNGDAEVIRAPFSICIATPCTASDSAAVAIGACKCAAASTTNECVVGKFCWADNTCNDAAKPASPTTASPTTATPSVLSAATPLVLSSASTIAAAVLAITAISF